MKLCAEPPTCAISGLLAKPRDVHREMMTLGLGIIGATIFSTDLGEEVHALNRAMADIMNVYNAVVLLPGIRLLLQIPFTPLRKFVHARRKLHEAVDRLIAEHRSREANEREQICSHCFWRRRKNKVGAMNTCATR